MKKNITYLIVILSIFSLVGINHLFVGLANADGPIPEPTDPVPGGPPIPPNAFPVARAINPTDFDLGYTGIINSYIQLDGSYSYDPFYPDDWVVAYNWSINGEWQGWQNESYYNVDYSTAGVKEVKLRVKDTHGAISINSNNNAFVYINPTGSYLDIAIADQHPIIGWCVREDVIFDLYVENINYPSIYWFDIELNVRNQIKPVTPQEYSIRFLNEDPFVFNEDWDENPTWSSINGGLYTIDANIYWGAGTDSDSDLFWIHTC